MLGYKHLPASLHAANFSGQPRTLSFEIQLTFASVNLTSFKVPSRTRLTNPKVTVMELRNSRGLVEAQFADHRGFTEIQLPSLLIQGFGSGQKRNNQFGNNERKCALESSSSGCHSGVWGLLGAFLRVDYPQRGRTISYR
jgi:hypothetical protein